MTITKYVSILFFVLYSCDLFYPCDLFQFFCFVVGAPVESLDILMKTCSQWLSFIVSRHLGELQKAQFRILERLFEKITKLKSYLIFNETYIHNYVYIYIYI